MHRRNIWKEGVSSILFLFFKFQRFVLFIKAELERGRNRSSVLGTMNRSKLHHSQELPLCLPHGGRGPSTWAMLHCFAGLIHRGLVWKWSRGDLNWPPRDTGILGSGFSCPATILILWIGVLIEWNIRVWFVTSVCAIQFSQRHLLKRLSFFTRKIGLRWLVYRWRGFISGVSVMFHWFTLVYNI